MKVLAAQTLMRSMHVTLYSERASSNDWARVLAPFALFHGVSRRRLRKLVCRATFVERASGEIIVARDDPADSLYVILSGTVTARSASTTRGLKIGDHFGDAGIVDGSLVGATVVSTSALHAMRVPLRTYLSLTQRRPAISVARLGNLAARVRRLEPRTADC
jgi:CRP-like cAMP-binding protein